MSLFELYDEGLEILGDGIGDFVPWLGIVGKVAGGALGGGDSKKPDAPAAAVAATAKQPDVAAQVKQVLDEERKRQQQEKLEASVRNTQMATIAVGLGAAGLAAWMILKK